MPWHAGLPGRRAAAGANPFGVRKLAQVVLVSLLLLAIGCLIPYSDSHGRLSDFLAGVGAVVVLGALFAVPARFLPAITLLVILLVPAEATQLPKSLQGAAFGLVPLVVWMIRASRSTQTPTALRLLGYLLGIWLILSYVFAPLHTHRGTEWLLTAGIALVFAVIRTPAGLNARSFRAVFLGVTTALGLYALLEGFVLHQNVLFAPLFEHLTWWSAQHDFSVSYRITTLLGHPLFNGLVFSAAAVLAASDLLERRGRLWFALARFLVLVGATEATHSRGAAIALGVGVITVLIFSRGGGRAWRTRRLALSASFVAGAIILLVGVHARDESREGKSSAEDRITLIKRTSEALRGVEPFGAGPGESASYRKARRLPGWETDLENSYAELTVSLGPIGALLMVILFISVVIYGLKNPLIIGETATLLTILVDIAGFNAIEPHRPVPLLIGLFMIAIITAPRAVSRRRRSTSMQNNRRVALAS